MSGYDNVSKETRKLINELYSDPKTLLQINNIGADNFHIEKLESEIKLLKEKIVQMRILLIRCHFSIWETGHPLHSHPPLDRCECEVGQIVRATEGYHDS